MKSNHKFLISCLPRSRSAWLACALSDGYGHCEHEYLIHGYDHLNRYLDQNGVIGSCETVYYTLDTKLHNRKDVKHIVILRNPHLVIKSLKKILKANCDIVWEWYAKLQIFIEEKKPLVVRFDELDEKIGEIAHYIDPNWSFDTDRAHLFSRMNIQWTEKWWKAIKQAANHGTNSNHCGE